MATTTQQEQGVAATSLNKGAGLLRFALWFGLIDSIVFGVLVFFTPAYIVETLIESSAFPYFALRWGGGILMALALANWLMLKNPKGQLQLMTTAATASLLAGAGMAWSWLADEYTGNSWMLITMLIGTLGLSTVQWLARSRAREILAG